MVSSWYLDTLKKWEIGTVVAYPISLTAVTYVSEDNDIGDTNELLAIYTFFPQKWKDLSEDVLL